MTQICTVVKNCVNSRISILRIFCCPWIYNFSSFLHRIKNNAQKNHLNYCVKSGDFDLTASFLPFNINTKNWKKVKKLVDYNLKCKASRKLKNLDESIFTCSNICYIECISWTMIKTIITITTITDTTKKMYRSYLVLKLISGASKGFSIVWHSTCTPICTLIVQVLAANFVNF